MQKFEETAKLPGRIITAVGSLPHRSADEAVDLIFGSLEKAPHLPQLSRCDPREQMWIQFSEGLPRFKVDLENLSYYFDTSGDSLDEVGQFFEAYLDVLDGGSTDRFAIGPDFGRGIHTFLERANSAEKKWPVIKAQVTGPISFGMTVTDEDRKPIFYHPVFKDVAVKGMGLKAAWLVDRLKPLADNVVIFFDEPSMSAYGSSAFLGVSADDVTEALNDVFAITAERGGIPGVHCCGNTDWSLLLDTRARILNFDAVDYMGSLNIYPNEVDSFLKRGGVLAWGAVPNNEAIDGDSAPKVAARIKEGIGALESAGVDGELLRQQMLITPACGCAGLDMERVGSVYRILAELEAGADDLLG